MHRHARVRRTHDPRVLLHQRNPRIYVGADFCWNFEDLGQQQDGPAVDQRKSSNWHHSAHVHGLIMNAREDNMHGYRLTDWGRGDPHQLFRKRLPKVAQVLSAHPNGIAEGHSAIAVLGRFLPLVENSVWLVRVLLREFGIQELVSPVSRLMEADFLGIGNIPCCDVNIKSVAIRPNSPDGGVGPRWIANAEPDDSSRATQYDIVLLAISGPETQSHRLFRVAVLVLYLIAHSGPHGPFSGQ